jgi:tetratricopeptide (TPR) repeat protein
LRRALGGRRDYLPKGHWLTANAESLLGGCLTALERYAEAEPLLLHAHEVLRAAPDVPRPRRWQALDRVLRCYQAWGRPEKAVEVARKAVDQAPGEAALWSRLGAAQYRAGDWQAAVAALDKALQLRDDALAGFHLAMASWQLGDKDRARQCYDRASRWMAIHAPDAADLRRCRAEAAELLGVKEQPTAKE